MAEGSPAAGVDVEVAAGGRLWEDFLGLVRRERLSLFMKLASATLVGVDEQRLTIAVENEVVRREVGGRKDIVLLRDLARRFFGRPLEVEVRRPETAPAGGVAGAAEAPQVDSQQRLAEEALGDPLVQAAMEIFGGQVRAVRSRREPA